MAFEVYRPRLGKETLVTLSKNHLSLNKKLAAWFNAVYAELAYDVSGKTIRIRPGSAENGLKIKNNRIGARGFFKHFGITQTGRYNAVLDEQDKTIYVKIQ